MLRNRKKSIKATSVNWMAAYFFSATLLETVARN